MSDIESVVRQGWALTLLGGAQMILLATWTAAHDSKHTLFRVGQRIPIRCPRYYRARECSLVMTEMFPCFRNEDAEASA